jgi:hypothetical protein
MLTLIENYNSGSHYVRGKYEVINLTRYGFITYHGGTSANICLVVLLAVSESM